MEEIWKDIPGYDSYYQVSNTGIVRSLDRKVMKVNRGVLKQVFYSGRIKSFCVSTWGYKQVTFSKNSIKKHPYIHVLVAMAFIGEIPNGFEVNHIDGNKLNNNVDNLEIVDRSENIKHAYRTGLMKSNIKNVIKVNAQQAIEIFNNNTSTINQLSKKYNISETHVYRIKKKIRDEQSIS